MIIKESFTIGAPLHEVAAFLIDPEKMGRCVPGVSDLEAMGNDVYEAALTIRLGPIHARFVGEVKLDSSEAPQRLQALVRGRDGATGSEVQVEFTALLAEVDGDQTEIDSTSDVTIRGKLGQFGPGVITSTARTMVGEFAACAGSALSVSSASGEVAAAVSSPSMARVVGKSVLAYLAGLGSTLRTFLTKLFRRDPE
jgi:carbon monoxide dehydrogenase subunit G